MNILKITLILTIITNIVIADGCIKNQYDESVKTQYSECIHGTYYTESKVNE